jgi:hypothetical protein
VAPPWTSTGPIVENIHITSPILAQGVVRIFFLDGFEFYDPKLPKNDIFEGPICLDLSKSSPLNSKSSTVLGKGPKKIFSAGIDSTLKTWQMWKFSMSWHNWIYFRMSIAHNHFLFAQACFTRSDPFSTTGIIYFWDSH